MQKGTSGVRIASWTELATFVVVPAGVPADLVHGFADSKEGRRLGITVHTPEGEWTDPNYRASFGIDPDGIQVRVPRKVGSPQQARDTVMAALTT